MKRFVSVVLALILLAIASFAFADSRVIEVVKGVSIRTEANFNGDKIRLAQVGEKFEVVGERDKWYEITVDGSTGFIPKDSCALTDAPVDSAVAGAAKEQLPADENVKVDKVQFTEKTIQLAVGYTTRARYTTVPANAGETLTWKTSDQRVATVDEYGNITGVKKGSCKITVYAEKGKKQKAQITVKVDNYDLVFTSQEPQQGTYYYGSGRYNITGKVKNGNVEIPEISIYMMAAVSGGNASESFSVTPLKVGTDVITVKAGRTKTEIKVLVLPEAFDPPTLQDLGFGTGAVTKRGSEGVFNGHTYRVVRKNMGWESARKACENEGGHLVTITSEEEQQFIQTLIQNSQGLFIGLARDENDPSQWKWVTDEAFDYACWNSGEPNNSGGEEDCATLWNNYKWNDLGKNNTSQSVGYICEWDSVIVDVINP